MKKLGSTIILLLSLTFMKAQAPDSLNVNYYENFPYAYMEGNKLKGIEIDIIEEYVKWLKERKNVTLTVTYKAHKDFGAFYGLVKDGNSKVIGLGSVTTSTVREQDVLFSPPYLQNVAVLITSGSIPTVKNKKEAEITAILGNLRASVVNRSSHVNYLNDLKKQYLPNLKIETVETQNRVLENILSDNKVFGYVDIVAYWSFLKTNPGKFLKMQKVFNEPKEFLGFIMPKKSVHSNYINEFFEGGFGFTSTKVYHQLLEKYLGYEILESVEIK